MQNIYSVVRFPIGSSCHTRVLAIALMSRKKPWNWRYNMHFDFTTTYEFTKSRFDKNAMAGSHAAWIQSGKSEQPNFSRRQNSVPLGNGAKQIYHLACMLSPGQLLKGNQIFGCKPNTCAHVIVLTQSI